MSICIIWKFKIKLSMFVYIFIFPNCSENIWYSNINHHHSHLANKISCLEISLRNCKTLTSKINYQVLVNFQFEKNWGPPVLSYSANSKVRLSVDFSRWSRFERNLGLKIEGLEVRIAH